MRHEQEKEIGGLPGIYAKADIMILRLVSNLKLAENPLVRKAISEFSLRDIEIDRIPDSLLEAAVLVSNYPGVKESLTAVMKIGCELPGQKLRLKAIARREVITKSNPVLGGFLAEAVFPAEKDDTGKYSLSNRTLARALEHLKQGGVLWLSPTGNTEENGLKIEDLRYGAVSLALKTKAPIIPMGLITNSDGMVRKVKFGQAIVLPSLDKTNFFDRDRQLHLCSLLVLAKIATLLPPGQRGDFEDWETKMTEIERSLIEISQPETANY